ncbi:Alpha/Beta hydrolase protein [Ephemerocybe angulata]|uniref:Alpha/Beta hydrolase protein n=1 Tax=Ephemerocybe angulata TaxID=980116 RepID=A0A8H6IEN8_9AGAR|nr:Alpha/Beta hydrolase protein [Tulosesus angulatus]
MPFVSANTPSGPASFYYTISTPTHASARRINPSLPTVLFLHPVYVGHHIYHPQFADPNLRRFNLVALDARLHGKTIGEVPSDFRRAEAAEDVYNFMEALLLPPCHVVGLSMGACVALQLSVAHPERVLSMSMVSPLPLQEPADVAEGRTEIYECWAESQADPEHIDEGALLDAVCGALQLGFNGQQTSLIQATIQLTVPDAMRNWTKGRLEELHTVSVKFFCDRKPHPPALLQRVQCPINLIHCGADIAYPIDFTEELFDRMQGAGLNVRLSCVADAPHFGSVTKPAEVNKLILDFVLQNTKGPVPPAMPNVTSPFEDEFAEQGCQHLGLESDDSDDDITFN